MKQRLATIKWWEWPGLILVFIIFLPFLIAWSPVYYLYRGAQAVDRLLGETSSLEEPMTPTVRPEIVCLCSRRNQ